MIVEDFKIEEIGGKKLILKGVGKMFYQDGFPISMSVSALKKKGLEVSILHVADECMKNGWTGKTTFNKLKVDFEDDIDKNSYDLKQLEMFCNSSYEDQREMLFKYLFGCSTDDVRNNTVIEPINWLKENI